jgi:hypothetical protein
VCHTNVLEAVMCTSLTASIRIFTETWPHVSSQAVQHAAAANLGDHKVGDALLRRIAIVLCHFIVRFLRLPAQIVRPPNT